MVKGEQFIVETPGPALPRLTRNQILAAFQSGHLPIIAVIRHCPESECIPVLEFLGDEAIGTSESNAKSVPALTLLLQSIRRGTLFH
ncbi:hypothetical protein Fuma_06065 [Fuerstiella marisgermanici]|uniref:Uncharacterized protein n=1 Tax=Fuerstiella marisgermanici TaxID=1891926 RepID=A0A1P8WQQ7_9PLAN|nr:hypothetical protein Fuma_06065 [Fuerstiella marisgermanici]